MDGPPTPIRRGPPTELIARQTKQALRSRVPLDDPTVSVLQDHALAQGLEQQRLVLLGPSRARDPRLEPDDSFEAPVTTGIGVGALIHHLIPSGRTGST